MAVHEGEEDAREDVEVLVVYAQGDVANRHGDSHEDEDGGRHIHVALQVFQPELLDPTPSLSIVVGAVPARWPSTKNTLALHQWADDMFYLSHGGAVEGALQPRFVHFSATHLSEPCGVEKACTPGSEGKVHQSRLPGACGNSERHCL